MRGDGRVFKRGSKWWIAYYAPKQGRGMEHREPGGGTEREARRKLKKRLREVAVAQTGLRPFLGPQQERVMVEHLLGELEREYEISGRKSLPQLRSHMRHVRNYFEMDRAMGVTTDRVRDYISHRQAGGAAPATINREVEALARAFSLAVESGTLSQIPKFPALSEKHNARQGFFEKPEFSAVLANIEDVDIRDFLCWFYWTGMRPNEIKSLTWEAFDRETMTITLHASDAKTGYGRKLALERDLRDIVERRIQARRLDCNLIFHRGGKRVGEFRKLWKTACKKAGLQGKHVYDLRRTAVRNLVRAGVEETVAMKISGHRTRAVFDRYNITSDEDIRRAVVKTTRYVSNLPSKTVVTPITATKAKA